MDGAHLSEIWLMVNPSRDRKPRPNSQTLGPQRNKCSRIGAENKNQFPEFCTFNSVMVLINSRDFRLGSFSSDSKLPSVKSSETA